jgi:tRNA A-37 threonylcarbamoyl transferase component Bud32
MENEAATLVGQTIAGKYAVDQLLAIGGMGAVYRARQIALDRLVALKILHRDLASDRQYVERFQIEAQAASRLDHPNSVRMFDFGEDGDGLLYIAMEYAEGRNLAVVIGQDTPLAEPRSVQLMSQVLSALAVAHEMGVVHRDLKPENIIVTQVMGDDGEAVEVAKVCDFGIAKVMPRQPGNGARPLSTLRGVLMGTPEYMSPEQARGEEMTPASDIYSAGVVLYHLLTGQVPFLGDNPVATALKHVTDQPVRPSAHRRVNPRLEAACLRALKKDIADRFGSARDMRQALRAALPVAPETPTGTPAPAETLMSAMPATPPEPAITSRPTVVMPRGFGARQVMLGLALVALAGAGVFAGLRRQRAAPAELQPPAAATVRLPESSRPAPAIPVAVPEPEIEIEPSATAPMGAAEPATKPPEKRRRVASIRRTRRAQADQPEAPAVAPVEPPPPPPEPAPVAVPSASLAQVTPPQAASPPPPAPAPAHKNWDVSRATVSVLEVTTSSAISVAKIRAGVRVSPLQSCYQEALRVKGTPASGVASLHIRIDVNGAVRTANLKGGEFLPAMKPCLEQAIRAARVKDIDTGDAAATIVMRFQAGA